MAQDITLDLNFEDIEKNSHLILSVSPCRSSSTVWTRVFSASGIHSFHQPIKAIYRWKLHNKKATWTIPQYPVMYLQETLGPFTKGESTLNPLRILHSKGFPMEKVTLLIIVRDPVAVWSSWQELYQDKTCVENFITAALKTEQIRKNAIDKGIFTTVIVYESLRDNSAEDVGKSVFQRINIPFETYSVTGWNENPAKSNIEMYNNMINQPEMYGSSRENQALRRKRTNNNLSYLPARKESSDLNKKDLEAIREAKLFDIYDNWKKYCMQDLGIKIN